MFFKKGGETRDDCSAAGLGLLVVSLLPNMSPNRPTIIQPKTDRRSEVFIHLLFSD